MPLILPDQLPAIDALKQENIFTMGYKRADSQQIRPLRLAVLNLMPLKITTETDFIRILSNSALQIKVDFMKIKSHTSKNTPMEHMMAFYRNFEERGRDFKRLVNELRQNQYHLRREIYGVVVELIVVRKHAFHHELRHVLDHVKHEDGQEKRGTNLE